MDYRKGNVILDESLPLAQNTKILVKYSLNFFPVAYSREKEKERMELPQNAMVLP